MAHATSYNVFMLPDLEAYVHGIKFKSKLKKWSKSQGFKDLSPDNLKEWCTDSFVLDSLLKVNRYKSSPINLPISPLTPDISSMAWKVPPCRGNLLDDYKQSSTYKYRDFKKYCHNSDDSLNDNFNHRRTKFKRFWHKIKGHKNETFANSYKSSEVSTRQNRSMKLTTTKVLQPTGCKNGDDHKNQSLLYNRKCKGSTNVLRLLELI